MIINWTVFDTCADFLFSQVVCQNLFRSRWFIRGVLASVPLRSKKKFDAILNECVELTTTPWSKFKYDRIFNTLQSYLLQEQKFLSRHAV